MEFSTLNAILSVIIILLGVATVMGTGRGWVLVRGAICYTLLLALKDTVCKS